MKRCLRKVLRAIALCPFLYFVACGASPAIAEQTVTFPPQPSLPSTVSDEAQVLSAAEINAVNEVSKTLWKTKRAILVVVTITSLSDHGAPGWTIKRYSDALYDAWGIGSSRNNGILFVLSMRDGQARIRLPQGWTTREEPLLFEVVEQEVRPRLARRQFGPAIIAGVTGISAVARGDYQQKSNNWSGLAVVFPTLLIIGAFFLVRLFRERAAR